MSIHFSDYPCEICGKVFKKASLVSGHKKFVHTTMTLDDYYFCDLCPRKFKTKVRMLRCRKMCSVS